MISWKSTDGATIEGVLYTPADFKLGKKYPLLVVIHGTGRRASAVPVAVGAYIAAAYWFTASTSFANPAVMLARAFTNTFTGIRLIDVPPFVGAQCAGALIATLLFRWLLLKP